MPGLNRLACFVLFLSLISCKKEKEEGGHGSMCSGPSQTSYITSPDLLNCKFKTGTHWVYHDSVTGMMDSMRITSYSQGYLFDGCVTTYQHHTFLAWSSSVPSGISYIVVAGGLFKGYNGHSNSGTLIYPGFTSMQGIKHDSLFVYDQYYKNVTEITVANDPTESGNKSIYFANSSFGTVKHEQYDGSTLVSRKVIISKSIIR